MVAGSGFEPPIPLCGIMSAGETALDPIQSFQKNLFRPSELSIPVRAFALQNSWNVFPQTPVAMADIALSIPGNPRRYAVPSVAVGLR